MRGVCTIGLVDGRRSAFSPCFQRLGDDEILVCGIGPSAASTRTTDAVDHAEDALDLAAENRRGRGVSTMLMRTSFHTSDVHLARMVMPRSRSSSFESIGPLGDLLIGAKGAALTQQLVDQRRLLAVVDVGG